MKIEKIVSTDFNKLYEIDKSAFLDFWTADDFLVELETDNREYFGLMEDDKILAYVGLNTVIDETDIIRIAVLKEEQRKGYAYKLLDYVINYLKNKNVKKIMLEVSEKNKKAFNLYEKIGFKVIYVREKYYKDLSNAIIMELEI